MAQKQSSKTKTKSGVAERARSIRERMDRIGVRRASYQINDPTRGRMVVGNDGKPKDSHAVHLAPRR